MGEALPLPYEYVVVNAIAKIKLLNKLEFAGMPPQAMRAWFSAYRHCPSPLGIVTAKQLDKLEFGELVSCDAPY